MNHPQSSAVFRAALRSSEEGRVETDDPSTALEARMGFSAEANDRSLALEENRKLGDSVVHEGFPRRV